MSQIRNLDIKKLRSFVAIIDLSGVGHAADMLNQTQGAVSQQIKKLELDLGAELFTRNAHSLKLTAFGKQFEHQARRLLAIHDQVLAETVASELTGKVRLGLPWDLINRLGVPDVLRRFSAANPKVEIALRCAPSPDLFEAVAQNDLDLVLLQEHPRSQKGDLLLPDRVVWVGARNGQARHAGTLPLAMTNPACSFRDYAIQALDGAGRAWRSAYDTDSLEMTLAMIRIDLAIGVLLQSAVPEDLEVLQHTEDLPRLPSFNVTIACSPLASPAALELRDLIQRRVEQERD